MSLRRTTAKEYEKRLLRVQQLVEAHIDESLDPATLAQAAHFSMHHFHRIFRAQLGESVMQYVRRLKLERAARKLRIDGVKVIDLAFEAGYDSHEAFTRAFVDRFGVPPTEFRTLEAHQRAQPTRAMPDVKIVTHDPLRVAFMRSRGSYAAVGAVWQKLIEWTIEREIAPRLYGVCPDDPEVTAEEHLRFDACVVVDDGFVADDHIFIGEIPAGTYAVAVHHGPYDTLHETYLDVIGRWFPTSGYELSPDAVVEHYLNDPSTAAPADLLTEVRVRIADQ